jgi:hypothetical protein
MPHDVYIWEFLEEYRWEPDDVQPSLLRDEPPPTGDERWDALLAALAEHLAARHDLVRRTSRGISDCLPGGSTSRFAMKALAARTRDIVGEFFPDEDLPPLAAAILQELFG